MKKKKRERPGKIPSLSLTSAMTIEDREREEKDCSAIQEKFFIGSQTGKDGVKKEWNGEYGEQDWETTVQYRRRRRRGNEHIRKNGSKEVKGPEGLVGVE